MISATITVTALPGVSEVSVGKMLEAVERRLFGSRRGPLSAQRHAMAQFVADEEAREGRRIPTAAPVGAVAEGGPEQVALSRLARHAQGETQRRLGR